MKTSRALLVFVLAACATATSSDVEKARESLVGMRARHLSQCLGSPTDIETQGETEILTFIVIEKEGDPLPSRDPTRGPELRVPRSRRIDPETGRPQLGTGYCELRFEVAKGRVRKVDVTGRRADGLSNRSCILDFDACFARFEVK
jgi:hypothetical protein